MKAYFSVTFEITLHVASSTVTQQQYSWYPEKLGNMNPCLSQRKRCYSTEQRLTIIWERVLSSVEKSGESKPGNERLTLWRNLMKVNHSIRFFFYLY